ncbi:UbiA family prenyltransferase [Erysipelothrix sp. HDW6B]|uniref:UbiA family prenyltransferase n=1 Tax=Erysipelothrix TaxID=1647 RepID=UPI001358113B|nr:MULTISPECIES: UbiA family prenyltransferase [Erysipelothrix]QIK85480.1 UbiA family prenyltransferase [Erysipelothrix sp. HDW6B]
MKKILEYTEIQTKITSLFPFALTLGVMVFNGSQIRWDATLVFFVGMFVFDLTTTAINNYIDSKENGQDIGYTRNQGRAIIYTMLTIATISGLYLVYLTDFVILILGMICFGIGILYTWGPVPISRQPYGEIISGVLYGYVIPFILIHANNPGLLVDFNFVAPNVTMHFNLVNIIYFLIIFLPPTLLTSSIMLANNTCDIEADVLVKRYTLPYYIGKKNAVVLMKILYISVYAAIVAAVALGVIPWLALLTLATAPRVLKNYNAYTKDLVKRLSFKYIIKNFITIMFVYDLMVIIGNFL